MDPGRDASLRGPTQEVPKKHEPNAGFWFFWLNIRLADKLDC